MASLRVTLFGRLRCTLDDRDLNGMEARKVQELFIYLLLHRTRPCTREMLATLLWGERDTVLAKKYLRQTLWQLQSALEGAVAPAGPLLCTSSEWVEINPTAALWLDVERFEAAYAETRTVADTALSSAQVDLLREAVQLYDGDLLEGWYHDWCIFERERLQSMFLAMLDKLVAYAEHTADFVMGAHYCELTLRCDPARERTHRRLMRLHYQTGNRTAALRQYDVCVEMLRRELGVEPAQRTVALYEQIRADRLDPDTFHPSSAGILASSPATMPTSSPVTIPPNTDEILQRLRTVHGQLAAVLLQVQQDIEAVEKLLQR